MQSVVLPVILLYQCITNKNCKQYSQLFFLLYYYINVSLTRTANSTASCSSCYWNQTSCLTFPSALGFFLCIFSVLLSSSRSFYAPRSAGPSIDVFHTLFTSFQFSVVHRGVEPLNQSINELITAPSSLRFQLSVCPHSVKTLGPSCQSVNIQSRHLAPAVSLSPFRHLAPAVSLSPFSQDTWPQLSVCQHSVKTLGPSCQSVPIQSLGPSCQSVNIQSLGPSCQSVNIQSLGPSCQSVPIQSRHLAPAVSLSTFSHLAPAVSLSPFSQDTWPQLSVCPHSVKTLGPSCQSVPIQSRHLAPAEAD